MQICDIHASRLQAALSKTIHLIPFNADHLVTLNEMDAAFLEVVTSRFSKLQDTLGQKVFPLVLTHSGEDIKDKTFIDILNLFEKFGFISDATFWLNLRQTRNAIAHEYPDHLEKLTIALNAVYSQSRELLDYWESLKEKINKKIISRNLQETQLI
jgi:Fe2+ transport system protein B